MRASLVCFAPDAKATLSIPRIIIPFSHSFADPLVGTYVTAGGSKMHAQCFTCFECRRPICDASGAASPYYEKQGNFYCRNDYVRLYMPVCAVQAQSLLCGCTRLSPRLFQVCCVSVTSKYSCNDWGQVMCMSHSPEASQCFDCGRYITLVAELPKRQRLLQYLSSSSREALFSDVGHSNSPSPPAALTAAKSHVTCIVDGGRLVDGRTQVRLRLKVLCGSFSSRHCRSLIRCDQCFHCGSDAVDSIGDMRGIWASVVEGMRTRLGLSLPCDLSSKLQLVDPATMGRHSHVHQSRDSRATCRCITGLTLNQKSLENGREISRGVTAILMLRGLGRDMAHGVLAHECAMCLIWPEEEVAVLTPCFC